MTTTPATAGYHSVLDTFTARDSLSDDLSMLVTAQRSAGNVYQLRDAYRDLLAVVVRHPEAQAADTDLMDGCRAVMAAYRRNAYPFSALGRLEFIDSLAALAGLTRDPF